MKNLSVLSGTHVELNFIGGYEENEVDNIPNNKNGIYVAFACIPRDDMYLVKRILYIGKADGTNNLQKRIKEHIRDDHEQWRKIYMTPSELIVYCYAEFDSQYLPDVESALIFKNQPYANVEHKEKYNGKTWMLHIKCEGEIGKLRPYASVMRLVKGSK